MIKKTIAVLFLSLFLSFSLYAQTACNKLSESSLGISFCVPTDWQIVSEENSPYKAAFSKRANGFTPNINIKSGVVDVSLSYFVNLSVKNVLASSEKFGADSLKKESQTDFAAGSARGVKVVYESVIRGYNVRTIQYFFNGKENAKIIITATMLSDDKADLEELIDKSMATFQVVK